MDPNSVPEAVGIAIAVFMGIAMLMGVIGGVWLLILAFRKSMLWGLGSLLLPFVILVFAVMHWSETQEALMLQVAAALIMMGVFGGLALAAPGMM